MFHPVAQGVTNDTGMQRPASQNKPISIFLEEKKKETYPPIIHQNPDGGCYTLTYSRGKIIIIIIIKRLRNLSPLFLS
jgi:hypothetical protein